MEDITIHKNDILDEIQVAHILITHTYTHTSCKHLTNDMFHTSLTETPAGD